MKTLPFLVLLSLFTGSTVSRLTATTISVLYGGQMYSSVAALTADFNSGPLLPSGFEPSANAGIIPGGSSEADVYEAPSGDTTNYAYVSGGGSLTETFSTPVSYFGLYWGSPDVYNTLTLTDSTGAAESYSPGSTLPGLAADQSTAAYVSFTTYGVPWVSAEFTSLGPAFEFDNISTSTEADPAPEPGTIFLVGSAILILGLWRRWKRE